MIEGSNEEDVTAAASAAARAESEARRRRILEKSIQRYGTEEESTHDEDVVAAARAEAEARRRRILEKSNQRLGIVSGEVPLPTSALVDPAPAAAPASAAPAAADPSNNNITVETVEEETTTTTSTGDENATAAKPATSTTASGSGGGKSASTAARVQAMRKRRFKKNEAAKEEASSSSAAAVTDNNENGATAEAKDQVKTVEAAAQLAAAAGESPPPEATCAASDTTTTTTDAPGVSTSGSDDADGESTKKYLGVAKMRRQMIKKKHEQETADSAATATSSKTKATPTAATKPTVPSLKKKSAVLIPVVLHWITILLLFGSGLKVGLQQQPNSYLGHAKVQPLVDDTPVVVQMEWGPRQRGLLSWINKDSSNKNATTSSTIQRNFAVVLDDDDDDDMDQEKKKKSGKDASKTSEFEDQVLSITDSTSNNIDPIFRVDLDKVTQGPGILLQLARGAVAMHRLLLSIFFYAPQRFILNLWRLPHNLWTTPPVLCVLALLIRQGVAKFLLGQHDKLPTIPQNEQQKNLVTMLTQTAMSFVTSSFPTVVKLYEAWNHLRSDLYIVLCGLFVGLAWSYSGGSSIEGTSHLVKRNDEL